EEAERFEPPRGSRAHVSLVVVAVDDDRPVAVELTRPLPFQLLEGDVDCAREVLFFVFVVREHFDELRSIGDELLNVIAVDWRRHQSSASTSPKIAVASSIASETGSQVPVISG